MLVAVIQITPDSVRESCFSEQAVVGLLSGSVVQQISVAMQGVITDVAIGNLACKVKVEYCTTNRTTNRCFILGLMGWLRISS